MSMLQVPVMTKHVAQRVEWSKFDSLNCPAAVALHIQFTIIQWLSENMLSD